MDARAIFNSMQNQLNQLLHHAPKVEIASTIDALVQQGLNRLQLVTREEFDVQTKVLEHTRARLEALEDKLISLDNNNPA